MKTKIEARFASVLIPLVMAASHAQAATVVTLGSDKNSKSNNAATVTKDDTKSNNGATVTKDDTKTNNAATVTKDDTKSNNGATVTKDETKENNAATVTKDDTKSNNGATVTKDETKENNAATVTKDDTKSNNAATVTKDETKENNAATVTKDETKENNAATVTKDETKSNNGATVTKDDTKSNNGATVTKDDNAASAEPSAPAPSVPESSAPSSSAPEPSAPAPAAPEPAAPAPAAAEPTAAAPAAAEPAAAAPAAPAATPATSKSFGMIISTAEGVGAFNSTLSGTKVQTFDNLLGHNTNVAWEGVGTFSELNVINADQYGGAPSADSPTGTPYVVEGIGKVSETVLKLDQATSYFGLYWSAGDAANNMKFYSNGVLVADFTTENLMNLLPKSYYGNPIEDGWQSGKNTGEPYGFINFIGDENTSWDTIVFGNTHGSGFEADNYTVRTNGWNPTADGALPGDPLLFLQSTDGNQTISQISDVSVNGDKVSLNVFDPKTGKSSLISFAPAAPAAPAPPLPIIAAFAVVIGLKTFRRKKSA